MLPVRRAEVAERQAVSEQKLRWKLALATVIADRSADEVILRLDACPLLAQLAKLGVGRVRILQSRSLVGVGIPRTGRGRSADIR